MNFVPRVSQSWEMHSNQALLETDRQFSTLNSSLVLISQAHVPLLIFCSCITLFDMVSVLLTGLALIKDQPLRDVEQRLERITAF